LKQYKLAAVKEINTDSINKEYKTTKISAVTKLLFHFSDLITSNDMKTITTIHSIYNTSIHMQQNKQTTPTMHVSRVVVVLCHVIRVTQTIFD